MSVLIDAEKQNFLTGKMTKQVILEIVHYMR